MRHYDGHHIWLLFLQRMEFWQAHLMPAFCRDFGVFGEQIIAFC
jgi:hypothetical protein